MAALASHPAAASGSGHLSDLVTALGELNKQTHLSRGAPAASWSRPSESLHQALTVVRATSASINDAVTRFNLVHKASPTEAVSASVTAEVTELCHQLVTALNVVGSAGAGDSLKWFLSASVRAILHTLRDLVQAALDGQETRLNSLTGAVWEACSDMEKTPKTNKMACRRELMQWSLALKDTVDEFKASLEEASSSSATLHDKPDIQGGGGAGADGDGPPDEQEGDFTSSSATVHDKPQTAGSGVGADDGDGPPDDKQEEGEDFCDDDFDFADMDDSYSAPEVACVEALLDLLRNARACIRAANDALNTAPEPDGSASGGGGGGGGGGGDGDRVMAWAQRIQEALRSINDRTGELGVLLYPARRGAT